MRYSLPCQTGSTASRKKETQRLTKEIPAEKCYNLGIDEMASFPTNDWLCGQPAANLKLFESFQNLNSHSLQEDSGLWTVHCFQSPPRILAGTLQGATYIVKFSLPARQTPFQVVDLLLQLNLPLFGMLSLRRLEQCV